MRRSPFAAAGLAVALLLGACGSDGASDVDSTGSAAAPATEPPPSAPAATSPEGKAIQVPDVEVLSVPSGERVNVSDLARGQDVLFWFYAPH